MDRIMVHSVRGGLILKSLRPEGAIPWMSVLLLERRSEILAGREWTGLSTSSALRQSAGPDPAGERLQ